MQTHSPFGSQAKMAESERVCKIRQVEVGLLSPLSHWPLFKDLQWACEAGIRP